MATQQYTAEQVATALRETKGLTSYAAKRLGCTPETVRNYMKRYASVRQAAYEERESVVDLAELKLFSALNNGIDEPINQWAVTLVLKTLGKDRGYTERHEQDHRGAVGFVVDIGDDSRSS